MRSLLEDAAVRAIRYLETLDERSVAPDPRAVAALSTLGALLGCILLFRRRRARPGPGTPA